MFDGSAVRVALEGGEHRTSEVDICLYIPDLDGVELGEVCEIWDCVDLWALDRNQIAERDRLSAIGAEDHDQFLSSVGAESFAKAKEPIVEFSLDHHSAAGYPEWTATGESASQLRSLGRRY